MASKAELSFKSALSAYRSARLKADCFQSERSRDAAIARLDEALDAMLRVQSPGLATFREKLSILEFEYGPEAQPRHLAAIYADAHRLPWP